VTRRTTTIHPRVTDTNGIAGYQNTCPYEPATE
jgi:hypothetical protein